MRKTVALATALCLAVTAAAAAHAADDVEAQRQELLRQAEALQRNEAGRSAAERLQEFIDLYFDYFMLTSPEFATFIGHPRGHDRWSDLSLAAVARGEEETGKALEVLASIDRGELEGEDRLNYDLLHRTLSESVEGARFPGEYLVISQMSGVHQSFARVLQRNPARSVADYEATLARLRGIPTQIGHTIERLEKGLEQGVTPPQVTLRSVPQQVANLLVDDAMASPLLAPFTRMPDDVPTAERERLQREAAEVFTEQVAPALQRLRDFLAETYVPQARQTIAMRDLPEGEAWYAYNVRQMTTTDMTPEQIHQLGLSEVARIRGQMQGIMESTGFAGSLAEFFDFLRSDEQFYFDTPEELLAAYRDIAKRADPEMVKLFGTLPRLPYGVKAVPPETEQQQTTAYYEMGSLEAGQPGWFYANTYDLKSRPKWEMEALTLHEAVPGHHLQIALAQEQEGLPWFRRFGGETAFVEGWGLYAESLGEEMGFYQDPYAKFGQLTYEMWRAIRLVVDTGMHHLGWSRQQAIDYFKENAGKAEHDITVEVDRYIVWPGQALAYKIGELKIKELRAYARQELGPAFDVRQFHDVVLLDGALPLDVLETKVKEWVAAEKAAGQPAEVERKG
ncbi:MAG TPA: DUF885 domain-containing protein [Thermoanaerobaculia bacterium]|nr:DUF885 domain-containing protein [Thermoanaerobaculia bacterium]